MNPAEKEGRKGPRVLSSTTSVRRFIASVIMRWQTTDAEPDARVFIELLDKNRYVRCAGCLETGEAPLRAFVFLPIAAPFFFSANRDATAAAAFAL